MFNTLKEKLKQTNNIKNNLISIINNLKNDEETKKELEEIIVLMILKDNWEIPSYLINKKIELENKNYILNNTLTNEWLTYYHSKIGYLNDGKLWDEIKKIKDILWNNEVSNLKIWKVTYRIILIIIFWMLKDHPIWDVLEVIEWLFYNWDNNKTIKSKWTTLTFLTKVFL